VCLRSSNGFHRLGAGANAVQETDDSGGGETGTGRDETDGGEGKAGRKTCVEDGGGATRG
jgi:hypothetical protein